ncbi:hypothetical protein [Streptomyces sp. S.PNR 29]|uniref:hypothetical protein n=1 Tax=Streptomyces sp. S.PNR 29 TaxID=2973805 RepID=UPI0025B27C72|nr:hypothetical protein [Streptomyces sp. S.PNR 29]MDN0197458.1 hypothetical protein [Streptomyces sp. S.PNR 29]
MSEETVPQQGGGAAAGRPKGLLEQMEELMAALNADLSALGADLRSAGGAQRPSAAQTNGALGPVGGAAKAIDAADETRAPGAGGRPLRGGGREGGPRPGRA